MLRCLWHLWIFQAKNLWKNPLFDCNRMFFSRKMEWRICQCLNWFFYDKETWSIFVKLSASSKVTQSKINFVKNYPQWGLNPQPPDHHSNALPTERGRNPLSRRFLKWALFVSCTTSHVGLCSFLESIEHDFKALMIHTDNQIVI